MKTATSERTVKTHNIGDSISFGISEDGLPYIFDMLRNSLYSDKVKAVIREYSTNAYDEHVKANIADRPFEITLPTRFDPQFKIRNFGQGLSSKDVNEVYCFYGESTKRDSNDYVGQLGIGSKSGFAYGDNFIVNAFNTGGKTSYNAWLDESEIGKITVLSSESTDEEDGTEIVVPVGEYDIDEFIDTAKEVFQYFKVKPIVHGLGEDQMQSWGEDLAEPKFEYQGKGWALLTSHRGDVNAVMGNVGYEVDLDPVRKYLTGFITEADKSCHLEKKEQLEAVLSKVNVFEHGEWWIDFEIGGLQMAASRESLQYTKKTSEAIVSKLVSVFDDLHSQLVNRFANCKTMYEAMTMYGELDRGSNVYTALRSVDKFPITWNGIKVDSWKYHADEDIKISHYEYRGRSDKYVGKTYETIKCEKSTLIVENDIGHRRGILLRLCPFLEDRDVYVIRFSSNKAEKRFRKENHFDAPTTLLSELPEVDPVDYGMSGKVKTDSSSGGAYNPKNAAKVVVLKTEEECKSIGRPTRYRWQDNEKNSDFWQYEKIDFTKGGVYVPLEKFRPKTPVQNYNGYVSFNEVDSYDFNRNVRKDFGNLDIDMPVIYGVKPANQYKFEKASNWILLHEYMSQKIKELMDSKGMLQSFANTLYMEDELSDHSDDFELALRVKDEIGEGPMSDLAEKVDEMSLPAEEKKSLRAVINIAKRLDVKFKKVKRTHDLKKALKAIEETYPLLLRMSKYELRKQDYDGVADYVNAIDNYEK